MSGDDHGHGHGHDSHAGPEDIIPVGSWQDAFLALICFAVLGGFAWWGQGLQEVKLPEHHGGHEEHSHEVAAPEGADSHASDAQPSAEHGASSEAGTAESSSKAETPAIQSKPAEANGESSSEPAVKADSIEEKAAEPADH